MTLYLSKIEITQNRQGFRLLGNPYKVHQNVAEATSGDPRPLFRIESSPTPHVLVQSHMIPDWTRTIQATRVIARTQTRDLNLDKLLAQGNRYYFRLLANPVKENMAGKKVALLDTNSINDWLRRKMANAGAELIEFDITQRGNQTCFKPIGEDEFFRIEHNCVRFDGLLAVKDPELLKSAVEKGIGRAKGFGMGLLSLRPVE